MKSSSSSAMRIPVRPIPPDLPLGYRFYPTDEELIDYLVLLLLHGLYSHDMPIGFVNFLEFEPWELPGQSKIKSDDQVWYFFCRRVVYMNKKKKMFKRKTPAGHWKPTGESTIIENLGKNLGERRTLRFYKDSPKVEKTEWIAYEYEIKQTSILHNPDEFVIIKLMNSLGEKRTKMSKQNFKKMLTSDYDQNQSLGEIMSTSDFCSHEVSSADFEYQNAGNMSPMSAYSILQQSNPVASGHEVMTAASSSSHDFVLSDFDTSEPGSRAIYGCQNQSSITEVQVPMSYIPENHEGSELSNCLLASDFENQMLPSEIEDSFPKTTDCTENQVTQDKTNPSCSATLKLEDRLQIEDIDLSFLEDDDFLSKLIDFDVDSKANETFPEVDPEVPADKDAFREPKRSRLNP